MKIDIDTADSDMTAFVKEADMEEIIEWAEEYGIEMIVMGAYGDLDNIVGYGMHGTTYVGNKYGVYFPKISKGMAVMFKLAFGGQ